MSPDEIKEICGAAWRDRKHNCDRIIQKAGSLLATTGLEQPELFMFELCKVLPPPDLQPYIARMRFCTILLAKLGN